MRKAGIVRADRPAWSAYRTTSWLDSQGSQMPIEYGFSSRPALPGRPVPKAYESARIVAAFIAHQIGSDGFPCYQYHPVTDTIVREGPIGRIILALDALAEAAAFLRKREWTVIAQTGLQHCVERLAALEGRVSLGSKGRTMSAAAECEMLAALSSWLPQTIEQLFPAPTGSSSNWLTGRCPGKSGMEPF